MKNRFKYVLVTALCMCCSSALGASLTVTPSGAGSFVVQGGSMDGVAGIDMTIGYDAASLSSPSVSWGSLVSGALSLANTGTPGSIKIAIIRTEPFSGNGPIAVVSFASQTGSAGMKSVSARLIDSKGGNLPVHAVIAPGATGTPDGTSGQIISAAGIPFSQPATPPAVTSTATAAVAPVMTGLGTVSMPGDNQPRNELPPPEPKPAPPAEAAEAAESKATPAPQPVAEKPVESPEPADIKETVYLSVLERFRGYQGEKTPENLLAIFKAGPASIRQEPEVVVSDGTAKVRVTADLSAIKGTSPNFALTGATLVSLKKGEDSGIWVLEALPQLNSVKAAVTIMNSSSVIEFPLTVVPPASGVSANQADFAAFLKDSGAKKPLRDLNGDGRHDYLDDFIYTAHYVIATTAAAKKTK